MLTSTSSPTTTAAIVAWEFANLEPGDPFDTAVMANNQASTLTPAGPAITTTSAGELVVATVLVTNTVAGIHAGTGFTNDSLAHSNGWGHLLDAHAPAGVYQPIWDVDITGSYCGVTAAFLTSP
jgi:hypothetical protein